MKFWTNQIKMSFIFLLPGVVCLQMFAAGSVKAQNFTFEGNRTKQGIDFEMIKNLIIIPLYLDGNGPYNFILDTGVSPMIITDTVLAKTLDLQNMRSIKINGYGEGGDIDAYFTPLLSATIGFATAKNLPTVILKNDVFNLSSHIGKRIYGLIGYTFFQSFVVRINYISKRINFSLPIEGRKLKGQRLDLEILDNKPYINTQIVTAEQGPLDVKLIVDCGASHALSLEKLNEQHFPVPKETISANLGVGLSGEISGNIGRVLKINLGDYSFDNVLTNFPKYSEAAAKATQKLRNGNLGSDILKHFTVTFDYSNKAMYLRKNENFKQPFEHDMSGMEIYADQNQFNQFYIGRIEEDSPAEKAGLLVHDELVSVNFKKVENYTLDELSAVLKSDNGKTVLIEIWRENRTHVFLMKLKRRI